LQPGVRAKTLRAMNADVLVVDVSILGSQRWRRLAQLCEQGSQLQVIVCSGPSTVGERICALRAGAADWLNKPCHPEELIARIEAVSGHRRPFIHAGMDSRWFGDLEIRSHQFQAFVQGVSVYLTRREYQLIDVLAGAGGDVIPREVVYRAIWHSDMARHDRSVDVLVHKVRRKLEQTSPEWAYIHTHYGQGYRLAPERAIPERATPERATPERTTPEQRTPMQGPVQLPCRTSQPATLAA
jgi:DNA-binding response OmpR family regulator